MTRDIPGPAAIFVNAREGDCVHARASVSALDDAADGERRALDSNDERQLAVDRDEFDAAAFDLSPWRRACEALDVCTDDYTTFEPRNGVGWIRRGGWRSSRVPRGAFVLRELGKTTNGDGAGTMCDPTGEIRVVVHRDLMANEPGLRAGSAIVVRDAPVLSADTRSHAVCVSNANLVAIFEPEGEIGGSAEPGKSAKEKRDELRRRLLESAVEDAMAGVVWDDLSEDEAVAVAEPMQEKSPIPETRDDPPNTNAANDGPSDFALQLAAMFADEDDGDDAAI